MNERFTTNARSHGAIMTVLVQYRLIDSNNITRTAAIKVEAPGTVATSSLAIRINKQFLEWAEANLIGSKLLSVIARDKTSGVELFRSEYLRVDPVADVTPPTGEDF